MITRHSQTKYFVLNPDVDHTSGGAINATLYNDATTVPRIAVGAGLFYNPVAGSGNHSEINANPGSAMKFIYRRDTSTDKSPLYNRPWEESDWINAFCLDGVIIDQNNAAFGSNDLHLVGDPSFAASEIVPADLTTYNLQVSGHGDRTDWYNGSYNTPTTFGTYTSPEFSLGTLTDVQQRDTIVAELALDFNNKSRDMSFAMAIDSAGGKAGVGATLISDLGDGTVAVGTNVIIGYDLNGNTHSFLLTQEQAVSFAALDARLTALGFATAQMIPYVVAATANKPAGVTVAGTTNEMDMFAFMALDEGLATYDYRMQTKRRIEVGLTAGLDNVPQERVAIGSEGQGYTHQLDIQYREHNRYEETHRSRMPYNSYYLEFKNALRENAYYDYFVIEHCDVRTATSGMPNVNNATTIIAVVNTTIGDATSNPYFGNATALAQRSYVIAAINAFNTNNNLGQPTLS
jgi:hypothetical protein